MGKYAEGEIMSYVWGVRLKVANGLRVVAEKIHEDMRYRVSGYTYQLVPGEGVKLEWGGGGTPLLYDEKDHELFYPEKDRWVSDKTVRKLSEEITDQIVGRKWTKAEVDQIMEVFNVGRGN